MNLLLAGWRCGILFLILSIPRCPLLLIGCLRSKGCGYLMVKPGPLVLLGSNLTIYCHYENCLQGGKIFLLVNGKTQCAVQETNRTTLSCTLVNIRTPLSMVVCRMRNNWGNTLVNGMDLKAGLPPDKPRNVSCETWRGAHFLECTWERGWETHLNTIYHVSVGRGNGTQILARVVDGKGVKVPRSLIDEGGEYQLNVTAGNHFGSSQSDPVSFCLEDMVIPEAPGILQVTFENATIAAILQWNTTESSGDLRTSVRLHTGDGSWVKPSFRELPDPEADGGSDLKPPCFQKAGEAVEFCQGLVRVLDLAPLTEYTFQMRMCHSGRTPDPSCTNRSATGQRSSCSRWSQPMSARSPGKGPTQQLHVWRILGNLGADKCRNVTVMWKPPSREDYSGEVQYYKVFTENAEGKICSAALRQRTLQVPAGLQAVSISATTLYGMSPPATVSLRYSGESGTLLREVLPAGNGSALVVSWLRLRGETGGELLHYVLEWAGVAVVEPQWKKLAYDQNSTSITGLTAGVRYNVSLYAVTTAGVSGPSSRLAYSREQKPASGPGLSVLRREPRRILVQWDRLPVHQERGFVTGYSIYLRILDSSSTEHRETVNGSGPGQKWLDCPDGTLVLQATASTSAGEGPRGIQSYSITALPTNLTPFVTIGLIAVLFVAIIANLMCLRCVKERIKQKCLAWRPACLDEPLPKPGNSVAIRLLKLEGNEPTFSSPLLDPPLSPISLLSQEDGHPGVHVDASVLGDDVSYKPQIPFLAPQKEAAVESEEGQREMSAGLEDSGGGPGGLLDILFPIAEVDCPSPTLCPAGCSLLLQPPQDNLSQAGVFLGQSASEDGEDVKSSSLELPQVEIMDYMPSDPRLPQNKAGTAMYDGYFPQSAPACSPLCER